MGVIMPAAIYSYDPATPAGQVRLLIGDTDVVPDPVTAAVGAIFTDAEITAFLVTLAGGIVQIGAALALDALASDAARLAIRVKTQNSDTDSTALSAQLRAQAQELRRTACCIVVVNAPDQVFIPDYGKGTLPGNLNPW